MSANSLFIVASRAPKGNIKSIMGAAEYSYHFVMRGFQPLLAEFGEVVEIDDPATEADDIYNQATRDGRLCQFLHFTAPHNYDPTINCPTALVFAWEYDTIPTEHWEGDGSYDWRTGLSAAGAAIVHSEHTVRAVKRAMGEDYPVIAIPRPTFDPCADLRAAFDPEQSGEDPVDRVYRARHRFPRYPASPLRPHA